MKFLSLLHLVPLASARAVEYAPQIPIVGEAQGAIASVDDIKGAAAPSIGVHFTTSHAVAAAHYANGTTKDLVKIDGDDEYTELMLRWMDSDAPNQQVAESGDDVVLSNFISRLGRFIDTKQVGLALFPLSSGLQQAFVKASVRAGLAASEDDVVLYEEAVATHAALAPSSSCAKKSRPEQHQDVLFLAFDDGSFSASLHEYSCSDDHVPHARMIGRLSYPHLGWWHLPVYETPRAKFWARLQESIMHVLGFCQKLPGRIVLLGSHGADDEFKEVVKDAFWNELEVDVAMMLDVNGGAEGEWLAARGAAELAWRHQKEREQ